MAIATDYFTLGYLFFNPPKLIPSGYKVCNVELLYTANVIEFKNPCVFESAISAPSACTEYANNYLSVSHNPVMNSLLDTGDALIYVAT